MAGVKGRSGGARPNTGGARPGAGRPKGSGRKTAPKPVAKKPAPVSKAQAPAVDVPAIPVLYSDPKDYLFALMNDPESDEKLRADAAKALMPFIHGKIGEGGKKDAKADAAKKAAGAGRFAAATAPLKLVAKR